MLWLFRTKVFFFFSIHFEERKIIFFNLIVLSGPLSM